MLGAQLQRECSGIRSGSTSTPMTFDCFLPKFSVQQNFHDLSGTHQESDGAATDRDTSKHRCVCGEDRRISVRTRRRSDAVLSYGGSFPQLIAGSHVEPALWSPPPGGALNVLSLPRRGRVGCCIVGAEPPTRKAPLSAFGIFFPVGVSCDERSGRDRCTGVRGHVGSHSMSSSYSTRVFGARGTLEQKSRAASLEATNVNRLRDHLPGLENTTPRFHSH